MFLPHFDVFCDLLLNQTYGNMESICFISKSLFYFKYFNITRKPAFCPAFAPPLQEKKPFDVIYDLNKMKQFHRLLWVAKNCDWSRKIAPLSNLTRALLLVQVEWNLQRKKNWTAKSTNFEENTGTSSQFLSSEQPCEPKSLDVALKITGAGADPGFWNGRWIFVIM